MNQQQSAPAQGNALQLVLATGAFAVCFAVFGSVSAMMGSIQQRLGLSELQVWIAIAMPVLLGSLARIPLGMFTDRLGGRIVFIWTMALAMISPANVVGATPCPPNACATHKPSSTRPT